MSQVSGNAGNVAGGQGQGRTSLGALLGGLLLVLSGALAAFVWVGRQEAAGLAEAQRMQAQVNLRFAPQRAEWRARQDARMRGELSPLARVDYIHLAALRGWPQIEVPVGAGAGDGVPVPAEALAGYAGRLVLAQVAGKEGPELWVRARPGVVVRKGGRPRAVGKKLVVEAKEQKAEEPTEAQRLANGDVVVVGRARLLVAGLPADPSVAVYDQGAPAMVAYARQGLSYYPDDPRFMALAQLQRYPVPRKVMVESSRGGPQEQLSVGTLHFALNGVACKLEAFAEGDDAGRLFLVFRDRSSDEGGSYGAGRFLYAAVLPGDQVMLDFNQAWNPLCAYSKFFHCPMPPRQNHLPVAVLAGERAYAGGAH